MGKRGPMINFKILREAIYKWIEGREYFNLSDNTIKEIFDLYKLLLLDTISNPKLKAGTFNKFKHIEKRGFTGFSRQVSTIINGTNKYIRYKDKGGARFEIIN